MGKTMRLLSRLVIRPVLLGGSIIVLAVAVARALGFAQMVMHNSDACALYAVTSGGNLHVGCKGDPTMPK